MIEDAVAGGGISPGTNSSYPSYLTNVNGTLYFQAADGLNGYELWRINASGQAVMVEDAVPGGGIRPGNFSSDAAVLTNVNGTLYFTANDGTNGIELWKVASTTDVLVTTTADSGAGSLRQAIAFANATAGVQTIKFQIPGSGVHIISPGSALPTITDRVIIDGTTQPGFSSVPLIELNGTSAGAGISGLKITVGSSTVRGLAINRFKGAGIELRTGGHNIVSGNRIGTNAAGTLDRGNLGAGVLIVNSASNTIGGTTAATRNLISGNDQSGVSISGASASGNLVQGNFVGTNAAGTLAIANSLDGILINGASSNTIGGTAVSAANTIAFNGRDGVRIVGTAVGNRIQRNSLFSNAALGIDLNGNGVTANDSQDVDAGPNKLQNFPALVSAVRTGTNLTVTYSVPSTAANSTYPLRVEFYIADTAKQEGKTFLQFASYNSAGTKIVTFPAGAASVGSRIVATATDASGNTSEFSANVTVTNSLMGAGGFREPVRRHRRS